eukprot:858777_1
MLSGDNNMVIVLLLFSGFLSMVTWANSRNVDGFGRRSERSSQAKAPRLCCTTQWPGVSGLESAVSKFDESDDSSSTDQGNPSSTDVDQSGSYDDGQSGAVTILGMPLVLFVLIVTLAACLTGGLIVWCFKGYPESHGVNSNAPNSSHSVRVAELEIEIREANAALLEACCCDSNLADVNTGLKTEVRNLKDRVSGLDAQLSQAKLDVEAVQRRSGQSGAQCQNAHSSASSYVRPDRDIGCMSDRRPYRLVLQG